MANLNNSKPAAPPVIVITEQPDNLRDLVRFLPAAAGSIVFHIALLGLLFLVVNISPASAPPTETKNQENTVNADPVDDKKMDNDPFLTTDINPARDETDTDIQYNNDVEAKVSVPGLPDPTQAAGIVDGRKDMPPDNLPPPPGFGAIGQGKTALMADLGGSDAVGQLGGYGNRGLPLAGTFYGRAGATRDKALRDGGGTGPSEAAVTGGLQWLARHQQADGSWKLDDPRFKDRGSNNDIAGTAFGLLPLLGAGKTHKLKKDNPYDKPIEYALMFLIRKQNKQSGDFGGGTMYSHGLATIAMCEAYGLSQDPLLRRPAQLGVNFIVKAQHDKGGWRYSPGQAGDTSVVGWQVMALKSAQMAGLDVPDVSMRKAVNFLESEVGSKDDDGYGYSGVGSTPTMSAVGLLCRQYLQAWGDKNPRMIKGVRNFILTNPPNAKNMYYSYYATQVMHHFGGEEWKKWNEKMRDDLIASQEKGKGAMGGSWSSAGDPHGSAGGRLMQTSLSILTLEVYYRHLPLYYRDSGEKKTAQN
ncbi:MAG: terpene cyclase/mutase family protein [Planctomycetes bacterium]|nr:terpene cyclase/mutase family protein [Planctomycetota bacterium]